MKYLFDSSSIYTALKPETIRKLIGNYTLELARFEIGNIIWKERALHKRITEDEQETLMDLATSALKNMSILKIDGHENGILKLTSKINDSYYDSSYVYFANVMDVPLVTADNKLSKKIKGYVQVEIVENI